MEKAWDASSCDFKLAIVRAAGERAGRVHEWAEAGRGNVAVATGNMHVGGGWELLLQHNKLLWPQAAAVYAAWVPLAWDAAAAWVCSPDVSRQTISNQVLVFVLVPPHVHDVVFGTRHVASWIEVEHHCCWVAAEGAGGCCCCPVNGLLLSAPRLQPLVTSMIAQLAVDK
jgi:hypothetical protein